jgi:hypothetical protein
VELERLCCDANEIESGVEVDDNDEFECVCVFWASGSRGSLVITRYQSLPLTPGKVLPVCVTQ